MVVSGPSGGEISMVVAGSWLVDASEEDSDSLTSPRPCGEVLVLIVCVCLSVTALAGAAGT